MTLDSSTGLNKRLLATGAGLMAVGSMIGLAGMALAGVAVFTATRRYVGRMETSPRDLMVNKVRQAREASLAGADAWRKASVNGR
jgi:hypothetical protein